MPKADFYSGLALAEQVRKLADHHSDPAVRHISRDEAAILDRAVMQLEAGVPAEGRRAEWDEVWERLKHVYVTTIVVPDGDIRLEVASVPIDPRASEEDAAELLTGLDVLLQTRANPRTAQLALNALFRSPRPSPDELAQLLKRRSPPSDSELGESENELINRALYQPTVVVEQSPPSFAPLAVLLADSGEGWVAIAEEAGDPLTVVVAFGTLLTFRLLRGPVDGLSKGWQERLYEWARPKDEEDGEEMSDPA